MTSVEKKQLAWVRGRVEALERKLEEPDWEHVNNPVKYCQAAYRRIVALENHVESRIQAGAAVRERITALEKRANYADRRLSRAAERRSNDRIVYRVCQLERLVRVRDDMGRARARSRSDCRETLCAIATGAGSIFVIGFAVYGVVTLISKFV